MERARSCAATRPTGAVLTATGVAADCLGADDIGTLEVGKWADLLVFGSDPLADITQTRTLEAVYIAGRPVT